MTSSRVRTSSAEAVVLGRAVRDLRRTIGWSQPELAQRAGLTQGWISKIELGRAPGASVDAISRVITAMGGRLTWTVDAPFLADRRLQRDAGHARCIAYVVARLRAAGWQVATEVEVGGERSRGWIDVLAHHPTSGMLLVVEVKTELHDLGAIQRQLGWYERQAWSSARRIGWRARTMASALLLLGTRAVDEHVALQRAMFDLEFSGRTTALRDVVAGMAPGDGRRFVAMIDPMSRRVDWLRPLRIDGRRTDAPYVDYADFMRARHERARPHRRSTAGARTQRAPPTRQSTVTRALAV